MKKPTRGYFHNNIGVVAIAHGCTGPVLAGDIEQCSIDALYPLATVVLNLT